MLEQLLFLVFILSPQPADASTQAFQDAAKEVLGARAVLQLRSVERVIDDEATVAQHPDASGIVQLQWLNQGRVAQLHVYVASERSWLDRRIEFGGDDAEYERARLLGYAVASMFVDAPTASLPQAPSPADAGDAIEAPAPDASAAPSQQLEPPAPAPGSPPSAVASVPADGGNRAPAFESGVRALEFAGVVSTGLGGQADALGATAALRIKLLDRLWLRAGVIARRGEIEAAEATVQSAFASVGAGYDLLGSGEGTRLSVRADLLGGWLDIGHFSADDDEPDHQGFEQFGADVLATGGYGFTATAGAFVSVGVEAVPGITKIYTHGERAANIPALRGVAELGFRADF